MTLTLTLRDAPVVPLEAEVLRPDRLAGATREEIEAMPVWHGNERTRVGEFFAVSGAGDDVRLEGDLSRVRLVGAGMTAGRLTVAGDVGMHAGAGMRGGELHVEGDAGDWAGAGMRGGTLVVRGSTGRRLGGAYPGERAGMRGGEIVVHGDAGAQAGAGLRRGLIAVAGHVGDAAGLRMLAGTNGTRVIDCGAQAAGGFEAGRRFAEICMAGLGTVAYAPVVIGGSWLPALTVTTDRPAIACLAAQYAGWRLDRDGYFAMGSGPARPLIRAEELYDDLDWDERASGAVLCLETREPPPAEVADFVAERAHVPPSALTLMMAPTASVAGGVQIAARVVETALHKLHVLDFDVRRVVAGFGSCPLPPVAGDDMAAIGRTNDAVLYGGQVHLTVQADDDDALRELVERLPVSASSDYGEPFGKVLKDANFDFYEIDPLLFSPAQIRLTSVASGRSFEAGRVNLEVLERSFWG